MAFSPRDDEVHLKVGLLLKRGTLRSWTALFCVCTPAALVAWTNPFVCDDRLRFLLLQPYVLLDIGLPTPSMVLVPSSYRSRSLHCFSLALAWAAQESKPKETTPIADMVSVTEVRCDASPNAALICQLDSAESVFHLLFPYPSSSIRSRPTLPPMPHRRPRLPCHLSKQAHLSMWGMTARLSHYHANVGYFSFKRAVVGPCV